MQCDACIDKTNGNNCEFCQTGYFGDATLGLSTDCRPCLTVCNGHSSYCATSTTKAVYGQVCLTCAEESFTTGTFCDECIPGYYMGYGNVCQPCQCNGHGICNATTGANCDCKDNTITDTAQNYSQCNTCVNSHNNTFIGTPLLGRQCYENFNINNFIQRPLGITLSDSYYFPISAVPYNLLDMIIMFDIFEGEVDCYITGNDLLAFNVSGAVSSSVNSSNSLYVATGVRRPLFATITAKSYAKLTSIYISIYAKSEAKYTIYFQQHNVNLNILVFLVCFFSGFFMLTVIAVSIQQARSSRHRRRATRRREVAFELRARLPSSRIIVRLSGAKVILESQLANLKVLLVYIFEKKILMFFGK